MTILFFVISVFSQALDPGRMLRGAEKKERTSKRAPVMQAREPTADLAAFESEDKAYL